MSARDVIDLVLFGRGYDATEGTADAIVAALGSAGYVILTAAQDASLTAEMERRGHEIASLRVTLGQMPPTDGADPIGCPTPGACSAVAAVAAERERALHECLTECMSEYLACMNDAEDETHDNPVTRLKARGGQDAVWKAMQSIRSIRARATPATPPAAPDTLP